MKYLTKLLLSIFFLCLLLVSITACGKPQPDPPITEQTETGSLLNENTYWTAYEWRSALYPPVSLPNEEWWADIMLFTDGTALLRDVSNDIHLQEESGMDLMWEYTEDGKLDIIYSPTGELYWSGSIDGDDIALSYHGGTLKLKRSEMPTETGKLYCPAQLKGTWMMVSDNTFDGYSPVLPGHFEWIVFSESWTADAVNLVADLEQRDYYGTYMVDFFNKLPVELLDTPVYDGCGNETWSVRIRRDESEDPRYSEYTMTLLGQDTMLVQKYSPWDERFTEYIFHRTLPRSSQWDISVDELPGLFLRATGYTSADGTVSTLPPETEDIYIFLTDDDVCFVGQQYTGMDAPIETEGTWNFGIGGSMLITSDDQEHPFRYAGAIRGENLFSSDGGYIGEVYELYLYYDGGILKLTPDAAG